MRYNVLTSSAYCRAVGLQYFLRTAAHRASVLAAALWADPIASSNVTGYGIAARRCRISVILRLLPLGGHSCRKAASAVGLSIHNMASSTFFIVCCSHSPSRIISKKFYFLSINFSSYHRNKSKSGCLISDSHFTFFKKFQLYFN